MFKNTRKNDRKRVAPRRLGSGFEWLEDRAMLAITWTGDANTDFNNMGNWDGGQPAADVDVEFEFDATVANGKSPLLDRNESVKNFSVLENTTELRIAGYDLDTKVVSIASDDDATLDVFGTGTWSTGGESVLVGNVDDGYSGTLKITTATFEAGHMTVQRGNLDFQEANITTVDVTLNTPAGVFGGVSTAALAGSNWTIGGNLIVEPSGTLDLISSDVTVTGTTTINTVGEVHVGSGSTLTFNGVATNNGRVSVNGGTIDTTDVKLINNFHITTGTGPGKFALDGDLEQSDDGTTFVRIGGTQAVEAFDKHSVYIIDDIDGDNEGGKLSLDGLLYVTLIDLGGGVFDPAVGDVFSIMRATEDIDGEFSDLELPALGGGKTWRVIYEDAKDGEGHDDDAFEVLLKVVKPDVGAGGFHNDAYGGLVVDYEIDSDDPNYEADPFSIGIYKSYDGVTPSGGALQTISITNSADLAAGSHSASFTAMFSAIGEDHRLIAIVDSADAIDESDEDNNVAEFSDGAFLSYGGGLSIHGSDDANVIEVLEDGSNYLVDIDVQTVLTIAQAQVTGGVFVHAHDGNDTVDATAIDQALAAWGGDGNDDLSGGDGDDYLEGGAGNDDLQGAGGDDTYAFSGNGSLGIDDISEAPSQGTADTLDFSGLTGGNGVTIDIGNINIQFVNSQLYIDLSSASIIENIIGSDYNDTITGNSSQNRLEGGGGDDTLNGKSGYDTYVFRGSGDLGADTINESTSDVGDTLDFSQLGFGVTVDLSDTSAQTAHANLSLDLDNDIEHVIGSAFADTITGNASANTIHGGGGDDVLDGGGNHDTLYGGDGDDYLAGGDGNDYMEGGQGDDEMYGGNGDDTMYGNEDDDYLDGGPGSDFLDAGGQTGDVEVNA